MHYHVIKAKHVASYTVWLRFRDGTHGEVDFGPELVGPIFEALKSVEEFKRFQIHPEFHALVWPNGADFALEFLYQEVRVTA